MPDETQEISDEDVDIKEQSEAASKILGGMENMNSNLLALTEQAAKDKAEAEERSNKRPRKTAPGSAAMETDAGEELGRADGSKLPAPSFQKPGQ